MKQTGPVFDPNRPKRLTREQAARSGLSSARASRLSLRESGAGIGTPSQTVDGSPVLTTDLRNVGTGPGTSVETNAHAIIPGESGTSSRSSASFYSALGALLVRGVEALFAEAADAKRAGYRLPPNDIGHRGRGEQ